MADFSPITRQPRQAPIWSADVPSEENPYYWHEEAVITGVLPKPDLRPRVAELFCGLGGLSQGFIQAGYQLLLGADIHKPSIDSYRVNHPDAVTILGDLRTVSTETLSGILCPIGVDVLVAGVPCQGFSRSNRKRNDGDDRNLLFREFIRLAKGISPRAVVIENVAGIASAGEGSFVTAICSEIDQALGLETHLLKLNAADFGVPQLRERVFFVGLPRGLRYVEPAATHGPSTGIPYLTVRDAISDLPKLQASEEATTYSARPKTPYQHLMRRDNTGLTHHRAPAHPPETIARIEATTPGAAMYPKFKQRIRLSWDRPSPTQVSGGIRAQFQFGHPNQARGLTIRERARIQSFPDKIVVSGGLVQGRVQTGNAVPPLLAEHIARSIIDTL